MIEKEIIKSNKWKIFKKFFLNNWIIFCVILLLIGISILNQWNMGDGFSSYVWKTLLWHLLGLNILFFSLFFLDYRKIPLRFIYILYGVLLIVIACMDVFKIRWIRLGGISLQPSEFLKPLLLLIFALEAEKCKSTVLSYQLFLKLFFIMSIGIFLVLITDLDNAFIIGVMFFSFLIVLGIPKRILIPMLSFFVIILVIVVPIAWNKFLKPYQKGRIYGYLYPEKYSKTWGYQTTQSIITIGSGGLFGQGFKKGWSTRLNYLPAKRTDLAFSVWAESCGFVGSMIFLILYGYLIYYALQIAINAKDWLGRYLSLGIALILFWQSFFNIGGALGILPMTSVPLPFLSYGGSITISVYFLLSLLLNISFRRYFFRYF